MITEADHANWTRAQLRSHLDHVNVSFGFDRLMYASDWPVSEQTHRYPTWVTILLRPHRQLLRDRGARVFPVRWCLMKLVAPRIFYDLTRWRALVRPLEGRFHHDGRDHNLYIHAASWYINLSSNLTEEYR